MEFEVGKKFIYKGKSFPKDADRVQVVLHLLTIDGVPSVRAQFIDNNYIHIFNILQRKNDYSTHCFSVDETYTNGVPMFWDDDL